MSMAEFDVFIEHRKGERNIVPDVLSHHPTKENIPDDNVLVPPENAVMYVIQKFNHKSDKDSRSW